MSCSTFCCVLVPCFPPHLFVVRLVSFPVGFRLGGADLAPASTLPHLQLIQGNQPTHLHSLKGWLKQLFLVSLLLIILS